MRFSKGIRKRHLKKLIRQHGCMVDDAMLAVRVGDLLQDCDCFNHVVSRIEPHKFYTRNGWFLKDITFHREDGGYFCTCRDFPQAPWPKDQVVEWFNNYTTDDGLRYIEQQESRGWDYSQPRWIREALIQGQPICTDRGCPLPIRAL